MPALASAGDVLRLIADDSWRMRVLETVRALELSDCWVGAGFVRAMVWDWLHGHAESTPLDDVDVIFFDSARIDPMIERFHEQRLAANKALQALHQAARLRPVKVSGALRFSFVKTNEAALKRLLDEAQKAVAKLEPLVVEMVETLKEGKKDRAALRQPRLQAGYDLAIGRALASRVRVEGYNAMLARLKQGKLFTKPGSTTWILEPADAIEAGSSFEKMLSDAKGRLQGVVDQHPGTPWAFLAQRELDAKIGWRWIEQ